MSVTEIENMDKLTPKKLKLNYNYSSFKNNLTSDAKNQWLQIGQKMTPKKLLDSR